MRSVRSVLGWLVAVALTIPCAIGQGTPGVVSYPTSQDTVVSLFEAANNAHTTLSGSLASDATTANVGSTDLFPTTGAFSVDNEILYYTGKTATAFTGLIRGRQGTIASAHSNNAAVQMRMTAGHHEVVRDAAIALEQKVGTFDSTPTLGVFLVGSGVGTSAWRGLLSADVPNLDASKITTGQLALARGGTAADLSGTGGASQYLKQSTLGGAISVGTIPAADLSAGISGTTNYVAKFTGANSVGNSVIYDDGTKVGIGTPTPGDILELARSGGPGLRLRDTASVGVWEIQAIDFYNQGGTGVHNHTLGIHFNQDGALTGTYPKWAESLEPRYVPGAVPNGLLEKNWDFTSINGLTSYRPFSFNVNLNTNIATMEWRVGDLYVLGATQSAGSDDSIHVDTVNKNVWMSGTLNVGSNSSGAYGLNFTGPTKGTVAVGITPSSAASADQGLYIRMPAVTGYSYLVNAGGSATQEVNAQFQNTGSGGVRAFLWGGSAGDAWVRTLAGQDWSFGTRRSTGNWTLANTDTLSQDWIRLSVTPGGLVGIGTTTPGALLDLGLAGTTRGVIRLAGLTSGNLTIQAPAVAGTNTLTLPAGTTDFSATGGASQVLKQTSAGGAITVGQLAASDLSNGTTGTGAVALAGSPTFTAGIAEHSRSTPMGEWITPTFAAGNFTASGSMTWTVEAGDVGTYAYTLVGKTMTVSFSLNTTSVGGTPDAELNIKIPGGATAAKYMNNLFSYNDNGAGRTVGHVRVAGTGETIIRLAKLGGGSWTASTNNSFVEGQITFEVQ